LELCCRRWAVDSSETSRSTYLGVYRHGRRVGAVVHVAARFETGPHVTRGQHQFRVRIVRPEVPRALTRGRECSGRPPLRARGAPRRGRPGRRGAPERSRSPQATERRIQGGGERPDLRDRCSLPDDEVGRSRYGAVPAAEASIQNRRGGLVLGCPGTSPVGTSPGLEANPPSSSRACGRGARSRERRAAATSVWGCLMRRWDARRSRGGDRRSGSEPASWTQALLLPSLRVPSPESTDLSAASQRQAIATTPGARDGPRTTQPYEGAATDLGGARTS